MLTLFAHDKKCNSAKVLGVTYIYIKAYIFEYAFVYTCMQNAATQLTPYIVKEHTPVTLQQVEK